MCYRTGKYPVCRRVRVSFSPEILQAGAVKGLTMAVEEGCGKPVKGLTIEMEEGCGKPLKWLTMAMEEGCGKPVLAVGGYACSAPHWAS